MFSMVVLQQRLERIEGEIRRLTLALEPLGADTNRVALQKQSSETSTLGSRLPWDPAVNHATVDEK